ncbi:MAG: AI-2E family transporter [Planctomycetes bacterium]|nr:AI-2E family transporter [Planctomycetota bacterium]
MPPVTDPSEKTLPPPWDRIFSLATRAFVWGLLIAVLYLLRPFLLLIFLTFVFAYIQAHGVDGLRHRVRNRPLRVTIVGLVFLGTIFATGFTVTPLVVDQARKFTDELPTKLEQADKVIHDWLLEHRQVARFLGRAVPAAPGPGEPQEPAPPPTKPEPLLQSMATYLIGLAEEESVADGGQPGSKPSDKAMHERVQKLFDFGSSVLGYVGSFLLSILFSFLIVLDLPRIRRAVASLAQTRVRFIYDEVAEGIGTFGKVLGRALEAQLFIAICNTILTAICVWLMDLPSLLVLSTIVFFCSFIPVAGTFISSTPICLLALLGGGFGMMLLAIGMILLIHGLETYVLNPQIYGHHMRMNPVFVLIVLTIGGKLFGVWGLLLGIPIVNFVFRHAIWPPGERPAEA